MMKSKYLILALGGIFAACSSNEDLNSNAVDEATSEDGIAFGITLPNPTRANTYSGKDAAEKLSGNFIVHGFKYYTGAEPTTAADVADADKQQTVFDLYNVNYSDGTGLTTQSNNTGWEYVGFLSHKTPAEDQTIRYWDYAATAYVFSAVSGTGIKATKIESGATVYDKGWQITVPAGASLSNIYTSARKPMMKPTPLGTRYEESVNLTFYSMLTKIRFAMFETIPGYNVHIDRFYYDNATQSSETNFAVDGNFRMVKPDAESVFNVTYYDNSSVLENRPKVSFDDAGVLCPTYSLFGTNIQAQDIIGTVSTDATYDQAGGEYSIILPYKADDNHLSLRVDYTLKALSGSETIKVVGATATVPASYLQWKENFAYTYIFKISDNTNGSTTPGGPEGLYPITFDGCVVSDEEGVQETISSVTEPSVTTYQKGVIVTQNDEYTAGDIYYTIMKDGAVVALDGTEVFEVNNYSESELTEALVLSYINNKVLLTPVATTAVTSVPLSDGSILSCEAGKCCKFVAAEGKTYAIMKGENCKLVKVVGTAEAPAFSLDCPATAQIATQKGTVDVTLTNTKGTATQKGVLGAKSMLKVWQGAKDMTDQFVIAEKGAGVYTLQLTAEAITKGIGGDFAVKFNETTVATNPFSVVLDYTFTPTTKLVVTAGKSNSFTLKAGGVAVTKAVIENSTKGISFEETTPGTYKVSAAADVATADYDVTIAGLAYTIHVNHYDFNHTTFTMTWCEGGAAPSDILVLTPCEGGEQVKSSATDVMDGGAVPSNGQFVMLAKAGGNTTLTFETAKCEVTVNKYELTSDVASFTQATGKATLSIYENGKQISARSNNVKVYMGTTKAEAETASTPLTKGFEIVTSGRNLTFKNLVNAGVYRIDYLKDSKVIGTEIITVNPNI